MKINKFLAIIAVILIFVSLLGACSNKEKGSADKTSGTMQEKFDLGGRVVTIAHWENFAPNEKSPTYQQELELLTSLEKKYNCQIEFDSTGDWGVYNTNATITALSGALIGDVIGHQFDLVVPVWVNSELIAPVDDIVDWKSDSWNKEFNEMYKYKGKQYGFTHQPYTIGHVVLFNKRVCKEFGLTDEYIYDLYDKGEWTWDKLEELAKKCTKGDTWGFGSFGPVAANPEPFMYTNGTEPIKKDENYKWIYNFDDTSCIEAAEFCRKLIFDSKVCYDGSRETGTWEKLWEDGKIAFYQAPAWVIGPYAEKLSDDEIGLLLMPKGPKGTKNLSIQSPIDGWFIQSDVKDKKAVASIIDEYFKPYEWRVHKEYADTWDNWAFDDKTIEIIRSTKENTKFLNGYSAIQFVVDVIYHDFGIYSGEDARAFAQKWKQPSQQQFDDLAKEKLVVEEE